MHRNRSHTRTRHARHAARALPILLLLLLALGAQPLRAQFDNWSPPLRLSAPGAGASFPDLLADPAGNVHVVWSASEELYDVVMYTALAQGAPLWDAPIDVVANAHEPGNFYVARPVLTLDDASQHGGAQADAAPGETWQMAMGVHAPGDMLYVATADVANARDPFAWTNNELAAPGYHVVPLASGGLLHVIYTQAVPGAGCQACLHILYTNSADGGLTWSNPIDVGRRSDRGTAKPQLIADNEGNLHLVWEAGLDGDRGYVIGTVRAMYAASYDNGASWSLPIELDAIPEEVNDDAVAARNIAITQAGDGSLLAAWWQMPEDLIYHRSSTDGGRTWLDQRTVPNVWGMGRLSRTRQDGFSMVTDSSGMVHLLMVGRQGDADTAAALLHLNYLGGTWSFPRALATYENDLPEWPRATIALGNQLRVVWHVRPNALRPNPDESLWEVWESTLTLPSPAIPAVAMPAAVPVVRGTATPVATTPTPARPTPVLLPAAARAAPEAPVTIETLMSENDDVLLLALALLPVALLVAAGLLWSRRGRMR
jgi:hypothetical protein